MLISLERLAGKCRMELSVKKSRSEFRQLSGIILRRIMIGACLQIGIDVAKHISCPDVFRSVRTESRQHIEIVGKARIYLWIEPVGRRSQNPDANELPITRISLDGKRRISSFLKRVLQNLSIQRA